MREGDEVIDDQESPLGFRWYSFDATKGFFLNGSPLKLRGANRHDDYPGLGWALPVSRQIADIKLVKEIGSNFIRTAHYAQHPSVLDACDRLDRADRVGMMDLVDIVGCNIYRGWYGGEIGDVGGVVDDIHRKHPAKPLIISEYGAGMELGRHSESPRRFDFSEEWGCRFHEAYLKQIDERPFIAGSLLWNIFDFGVEQRLAQSIPHLNQKGIYDYSRRPKDVYYLYVSQWTEKPMVYIVSHTWTARQGDPGEKKAIKVYSNCGSVKLFVNEESAGRRTRGEPFL